MNALFDTRLLRCLVVLAEELHFGRAAERLGMAQPRLSQLVKQAEMLAGMTLFARTTRSTTLTAAGEALVAAARGGLACFENGLAEARRRTANVSETLDIGYVAIAMLMGLPAAIGHFRSLYPAVALRLHELSTDPQLDLLAAGKLDLAIVSAPPPRRDYLVLDEVPDPLMAVLPAGHRLARRGASGKGVNLAELAGETFIFFPRNEAKRLHSAILTYCESRGLRPGGVQEAPSWHSILSLVAAGIGVSVAPACTGRFGIQSVRYRPIASEVFEVPLTLAVRRRAAAFSASRFAEIFRRHADDPSARSEPASILEQVDRPPSAA